MLPLMPQRTGAAGQKMDTKSPAIYRSVDAMHARGGTRTYKEGTCGQRYLVRRNVICCKYKRVIGRHMRTARNGIPAADGAATCIIKCAAYKDEDAVAIALQKWRACVGGCRAGRANVRSENTRAGVPNIPIIPNSPSKTSWTIWTFPLDLRVTTPQKSGLPRAQEPA